MEKLIKKITPLDYLVIFIALLGIFLFFIFYKRESVTIYVSTMNEWADWREDPMPPPYWLSNSLKIGDKAYHLTGGEVAEITNIENTEWGGQRRFARLEMKVNALYNKRSKLYLIKDEPLVVGNSITLNFNGKRYSGIITYIGDKPEDESVNMMKVKMEILSPNIYPWQAETYRKDFIVKNTKGDEIFKIVSSRIVPAEKSVETADGRIIRSSDPYFKDAYITAEAKVRCQESICYYNDTFPMRVGGHIRVHSPTSLIEEKSTIVSFELIK